MELFTLLTLAALLVCPAVDGATCTTKPSCEKTNFTLSTCTGGTCDCLNSSFVAVRSGCALLKMEKPVITAQQRKSNQVRSGDYFTLICNINGADSIEWYLNTKPISVSSPSGNYYNEIASPATVGSFTCKGIGPQKLVTSDISDPFNVVLLGTGGEAQSTERPKISVPTTAVFSGSAVTLSCDNIPMGYNENLITYKVGDKYISGSSVTIDNSNAGKDVTCNITSSYSGVTFSNSISTPSKLPVIVDSIQSVFVTSSNDDYLKCSTTPEKIDSQKIIYEWLADGIRLMGKTSSTYRPTSLGASISCSAQLAGKPAVSSTNTFVSVGDVEISANAQKFIVGQRAILACGGIHSETVTYRWTNGSKTLFGQLDWKLQLDNIQKEDEGSFVCYIQKDSFIASSSSVYINVVDSIPQPRIDVIGHFGRVSILGKNGNYWLWCNTQTANDGMTYEWTFNGVKSSVTDKFYSLPSVSSSNNGAYVCKAKYKSLTSVDSDPLKVIVSVPGTLCYHNDYCPLPFDGYTGICDVETNRCECSDGYLPRGDMCSGSMTVLSSTVIIAVAAVYFQLVNL